MRKNPAEVRRLALKEQERKGLPVATRSYRCPDCHDDITEQRTRDDMAEQGLTIQKPIGWHTCPAAAPSAGYAQTSYDWRTHGKD